MWRNTDFVPNEQSIMLRSYEANRGKTFNDHNLVNSKTIDQCIAETATLSFGFTFLLAVYAQEPCRDYLDMEDLLAHLLTEQPSVDLLWKYMRLGMQARASYDQVIDPLTDHGRYRSKWCWWLVEEFFRNYGAFILDTIDSVSELHDVAAALLDYKSGYESFHGASLPTFDRVIANYFLIIPGNGCYIDSTLYEQRLTHDHGIIVCRRAQR